MGYFLLTGATGLLGRYLLRDLTLAGLSLAVVVRRTKWESAVQRIETAMARWEKELGRALIRPVVLEGDLTNPVLGLAEDDIAWLAEYCDAVIHSAASLTFQADEAEGEPWRSNVQGTREVLEVCRRAGIRQFHHVSTAYVCGRRRGIILESELDEGQELGNDYEQSKVTAEKEVRACGLFDQLTVYRPSIIVGDHRTGYTTSYHGFYTPLRLVYSVLQSVPWETILQGDWLGRLELTGDEHKNLVPVDWVSAAMTHLIAHQNLHGRTYHLTNPAPPTVLSMEEAIAGELGQLVLNQRPPAASVAAADLVGSFRDQMQVYEAYWSDDPEFDSTNTQAAAPHLPCPRIDGDVMRRLVRFAIGCNFGWPRETAIVPRHKIGDLLMKCLAERDASAGRRSDVEGGKTQHLGLQVSGPGGGQWSLSLDQGRLVAAKQGGTGGFGSTCYLTSRTFVRLVEGSVSLEESIHQGSLVVAGARTTPHEVARLFRNLRHNVPASSLG